MKNLNLLTLGLAVAAAALVFSSSAKATQTLSYNTGDLFLGFEQAGATNNYILDIGAFSNYVGVTGSFNVTTALSLGNIAADLSGSNGFGVNWASNSQTNLVQWGIIGAGSNTGSLTVGGDTIAKNTLFLTEGELVAGTVNTPPSTNKTGVQGTILNSAVIPFENGYAGNQSTANSNVGLFEAASANTNPNSWSANNPSFNGFGTTLDIEQPGTGSFTGPTNSVLDLFELQPSTNGAASTYLGSFSLSSSGDLTFTGATAVPEPSTYAIVGMGAVVLAFFRRPGKNLHL